MREASRTIAILILGALLGAAGFASIDRWTRTSYEPPAFEQILPEQDLRPVADLERPSARARSRPYRNCTEARAADDAPLYVGEPGYGEHMDGDHHGIACEPYYGH